MVCVHCTHIRLSCGCIVTNEVLNGVADELLKLQRSRRETNEGCDAYVTATMTK